MLKSISGFKFDVKSKVNNRDKKFLKNIFFGGIVIVSTIISFSIKNSYDLSKSIDVVQNHYSSIKNYNDFSKSFGNVVYTDKMFESDIMTFKKLYVNNPSYSIASKDYSLPLSEFMLVKFYTGNDQKKINEYVNRFNNVKINNDTYMQVRYNKNNYLRKYKIEKNVSLIKEMKYNTDATFPPYLSSNFESYLKGKNLTTDLFYYSPSSKNYMNKYFRDNFKMTDFLNKKNNDFYNLVNEVKAGNYKNAREVFKAMNAYTIQIGNYNIDREHLSSTYYPLDNTTFNYVEKFRNLYTKNGTASFHKEPESGSKEEERLMSMW